MVTTDLPKYMNDVVHVSIQKNSIYSALPRVISLSVALTAGCVCDWMVGKRDVSITNARRTFIFLGMSHTFFKYAMTLATHSCLSCS